MRVESPFRFSKFDPRRTQWQPPGEPVRLPERMHQGSQSASPAREMSSRGRARSKFATVATAARLERVARSSAWHAAVMREQGGGARRGWTHGTRRVFTGDRLGESDVPAMPKLERRCSARALPAVPLTCHAWHVDGRHGWLDVSGCADHLRGRPTLFQRVEVPRTSYICK